MGGVYQTSLLLIGMCFVIWALHPVAALERCRAVLPRMGLPHCAMGRLLPSHGLGEHARGANGGTTIAAPPLNTTLRTRAAWAASSPWTARHPFPVGSELHLSRETPWH